MSDNFSSAYQLGTLQENPLTHENWAYANSPYYYRITVAHAGALSVLLAELGGGGNADADLFLYSADHRLLGSSTTGGASEAINFNVPAAGDYYIEVRNKGYDPYYDYTHYTLQVDMPLAPPIFSLEPVSGSATEDGDYVFRIVRSGDASVGNLVVDWAVASTGGAGQASPDDFGGALPGSSLSFAFAPVTFAAYQTDAYVTVGILGDGLYESLPESFNIALTGVRGGGVIDPSGGVLSAQISPSDAPASTATAAASIVVANSGGATLVSGAEGSAFVFQITLDKAATGSVSWAVENRSGIQTSDFSGATSGTVSFAGSVTSALITVTAAADTVGPEFNDAFAVRLTSGTGDVVVDHAASTVSAVIESNADEENSSLAAGLTRLGRINSGTDVDSFTINLTAGRSYAFSVNPTDFPLSGSGLDPYLVLKDSLGNVVARNNNYNSTFGALVGFTPTVDGTYTLEVSSNNGIAGNYLLQTKMRGIDDMLPQLGVDNYPSAPSTYLVGDVSAEDMVVAGWVEPNGADSAEADVIRVRARAGQRYAYTISSPADTRMSVQVLDGAGNVLDIVQLGDVYSSGSSNYALRDFSFAAPADTDGNDDGFLDLYLKVIGEAPDPGRSRNYRITGGAEGSFGGVVAASQGFRIQAAGGYAVEGDVGTTNYVFYVTRSGADLNTAATVTYQVNGLSPAYQIMNGFWATMPAAASTDFAANAMPTGSLAFAAGEEFKVLTIGIKGDIVNDQPDPDGVGPALGGLCEIFQVSLTSSSNSVAAPIVTGMDTALARIIDDENSILAAPYSQDVFSVSLVDGDKVEGSDTSTSHVFRVNLSRAGTSNAPASVHWAVDGDIWVRPGVNAANGYDFGNGAVSFMPQGDITFAAGETVRYVTLAINADYAPELSESFALRLSNPLRWIDASFPVQAAIASWGDAAYSSIRNDDPDSQVVVSQSGLISENGSASFTVVRSNRAFDAEEAMAWRVVADGTGPSVDASDFYGMGELPSGTFTFWPGQTTATFMLMPGVAFDGMTEGDERFRIEIYNPVSGAVLNAPNSNNLFRVSDVVPLDYLDASGSSTAISSVSVNGTLDSTDTYDDYQVNLSTSGHLRVSFASLSAGGDVDLELLGAGSSSIISDGDLAANNLQAGTYLLRAWRRSGTPSYALNVSLAPESDPSVEPLVWIDTSTGNYYNIDEEAGQFVLTVRRAGGDVANQSTTATWNLTRYPWGSSAAADDFLAGSSVYPSGSVSFAAGETVATATISVFNDTVSENWEYFRINLTDVTSGIGVLAHGVNTAQGWADSTTYAAIQSSDGGNASSLPQVSISSLNWGETRQFEADAGSSRNYVFRISRYDYSGYTPPSVWDNDSGTAIARNDSLAGADGAGVIDGNGAGSGTVEFAVDANDYFRIGLDGADQLVVSLSGLDALHNADLELLDEYGNLVASSRNTDATPESITYAPSGMTYYVRVNAVSTTGPINYYLNVSAPSFGLFSDSEPNDAYGAGTSAFAGNLWAGSHLGLTGGSVNYSTDNQDWYRIHSASDGQMQVVLSGLTADADLYLYDASGNYLTGSAAGGTWSDSVGWYAYNGADYYVKVVAYSQSTTIGYNLDVTKAANAAAIADDVGAQFIGVLGQGGGTSLALQSPGSVASGDPEDWYRFDVNSSGQINLALTGMSGDGADLVLRDSYGNTLSGSYMGYGSDEALSYYVYTPGTYYAGVVNSGASGTGYQLDVTSAEAATSVRWKVDINDSDVTAADFAGGVVPSGVVVFQPGQTAAFVTVRVAGDTNWENDEWFQVRLIEDNPNLQYNNVTATGVILNNDDNLPATTATSAVITAGGAYASSIDGTGDKDWVKVTLAAGKNYMFEAHSTQGVEGMSSWPAFPPLDPFLVLRDATGVAVAMGNDFAGTNGARINYTPTTAGTYYLEVAGNPGRITSTGEYIVQSRVGGDTSAMTVGVASGDDYADNATTVGRLIASDPVATGFFERAGDEDWFRVRLESGQRVRFGVETPRDVALAMRLVDANGNEVPGVITATNIGADTMMGGQGTDGYGRSVVTVALPGNLASGDYFLAVQGSQADGHVRSYRLAGVPSYYEETTSTQADLQPNNVLSVTMAEPWKTEGANNAATPYVFNVWRDGDLSRALSARWSVGTWSPLPSLSGVSSDDFFDSEDAFQMGGASLVFAPGQSLATITLNIRGDAEAEPDEYFSLNLWPDYGTTGAMNWGVNTWSTVARIKSDDSTIASTGSIVSLVSPTAEFVEGNRGASNYVFTVLRDGPSLSSPATVEWSVYQSGWAGATPEDFVGGAMPSGIVTFTGNQTAATVTVQINGDTLRENDEYFNLSLWNPSSGLTIANSQTTGRVRDDDSNSISLYQVSGYTDEGNGAAANPTAYQFYVGRNGDTSTAATVQWAVSRLGTASPLASASADDFANAVLPTGTLSFAAGQDFAILTVSVVGDTAVEGDEYFNLTLSNATAGWSLNNAQVTGRIRNDDSTIAPTGSVLSISTVDAWKDEGNGTANSTHVFRVNRSGNVSAATSATWTVRSDLVRGNIVDPTDFVGSVLPSGTVSFAANETSKLITVTIAADALLEPGEGYAVVLSNPGASTTIASDTTFAGIFNDDGSSFSIGGDLVTYEDPFSNGQSAGMMTLTVNRSATNIDQYETVNWRVVTSTGAGNADANDFNLVGGEMQTTGALSTETVPSGQVFFAPGQTTATVNISVSNDGLWEGPESFQVQLARNSTATLAAATVTILDGAPVVGGEGGQSFQLLPSGAAEQEEGGYGYRVERTESGAFVYSVVRSANQFGSLNTGASIGWRVTNEGWGDQASAADFTGNALPSGTISFAPTTARTQLVQFTVGVANDTAHESEEWFGLVLTEQVQSNSQAIMIQRGDAWKTEGATGTTPYVFNLYRSGAGLNSATTVNWSVSHSNTAGDDFAGPLSGTVTFAANSTVSAITVTLAGDTTPEPDEYFQVVLDSASSAGSASVYWAQSTATGVIPDDDGTPPSGSVYGITTDPASVIKSEGNLGSSTAYTFTIKRYGNTAADSVSWSVDSYYSWAGADDFLLASGGLGIPSGVASFTAGQTAATVTVTVRGDNNAYEGDEKFVVSMVGTSNPGGVFLDGQAGALIRNDDTTVERWEYGYVGTTILDDDDDYGHTAATAPRLGVLSSLTGDLNSSGDDDWFKVSLASGLQYEFVIGSPENIGASLRLLNSTGSVVTGASIDTVDGGLGQVMRFTPSASGDYYVSARSAGGLTGRYGLWAGVRGQDDVPNISGDMSWNTAHAQPIMTMGWNDHFGMIESDGDADWYRVSLTAGHQYDFSLNHFSSLQLSFEMYDGAGTWVQGFGSLPNGGFLPAAEGGTYTAATTGNYYLRVAETGFNQGAGGYVLSLEDNDFQDLISTELPMAGTVPTNILVGVEAVSRNIIESGANNQAVFRVRREGFASNATTVVNWAVETTGIEASVAIDGQDFGTGTTSVLPAGAITFAAGEMEKLLTLAVFGDAVANENEHFRVRLNSASTTFAGVQSLGNPVSTVILGDYQTAEANVHDVSTEYAIGLESQWAWPDRTEGSSWVFRVSRSGRVDQAGTVNWGVAGIDTIERPSYAMTYSVTPSLNNDLALVAGATQTGGATGILNMNGSLAFAAGETLRLLTITSVPDARVENNEGFRITLTAPTGATVTGAGSIDAAVWNDDWLSDYAGQTRESAHYLGYLSSGATLAPNSVYYFAESGDGIGYVGDHDVYDGSNLVEPVDVTDYFRFTAGASGALNLTLTGATGGTFAAGADIDVRLEDVYGNWLASSTWGGNWAEQINFNGLVSGQDYYVSVYSYLGNSTYRLALQNSSVQSTVAVTALNAYQSEGNSGTTPFTFEISRSGAVTGSAVIDWTVGAAGDTADADDFGGALPSGTVTFAAGEISRIVTIGVSGDTGYESQGLNEQFTVSVSTASQGVMVSQPTAMGYIINDDVNDTGGSSRADINSNLGVLNASASLTPVLGWVGQGDTDIANWSGSGGDWGWANPPRTVDYYYFTAGADGAANVRISGLAGDVDLYVFADDTTSSVLASSTYGGTSPDEVNFAVSSGSTYYIEVRQYFLQSAAVTGSSYVLNVDHMAQQALYSVGATDAVRAENAGGATTDFVFTVSRTDAGLAGSVSWYVSGPSWVQDGTGQWVQAPGQADWYDFSGGYLPWGSVSFTAGQSTATLTVSVLADSDNAEGDETFTVNLYSPTGGQIDTGSATGTILAGTSADQGGNTALLATHLGTLAAMGSLSVSDTVAIGGDTNDYYRFMADFSGQITLALTGMSADADVQVLQRTGGYGADSVTTAYLAGGFNGSSNDENVVFNVQAGTEYYVRVYPYSGGTDYDLSLTAGSDTGPVVWIERSVGAMSEGNAFNFFVNRSNTVGNLTVAIDCSLSTATTDDFDALPSFPTTVVIPDGDSSFVYQFISTDDSVYEGNENLTVRILPSTAYILGDVTVDTSVIEDNDFNFTEYRIETNFANRAQEEGVGSPTTFVFTVERTGNVNYAGFASWSVTGSVTAADFVGAALPAGVVNFTAGQSVAQILVNVADDALYEADETFSVTLTGAANTGAPATVTSRVATPTAAVQIINDDLPMQFSISPDVTFAPEGDPTVFTVTRSGDNSTEAKVVWTLSHLTTSAADLGTPTSGTLTFAASGALTQDITLATVDDALVENYEAFRITLTDPNAADGVGIDPAADMAWGVIEDNDGVATVSLYDVQTNGTGFGVLPTISAYGSVGYKVNEGNGTTTVTFIVERDGDWGPDYASWRIGQPNVNIADGFSTVGDSVAKAADFGTSALPSGYVSFGNTTLGALYAAVTVTLADDLDGEESDEWFNFVVGEKWATVGTAPSTFTPGNEVSVTPVVIRNDDDEEGNTNPMGAATAATIRLNSFVTGAMTSSDLYDYYAVSAGTLVLPATISAQSAIMYYPGSGLLDYQLVNTADAQICNPLFGQAGVGVGQYDGAPQTSYFKVRNNPSDLLGYDFSGGYALMTRLAGFDEDTNSTLANARVLSNSRDPYAGWLDSGDTDWYKVTLSAGVSYSFEAITAAYDQGTSATAADVSFGLYNASSVQLASVSSDLGSVDGFDGTMNLEQYQFNYTATTAGTYYLRLRGNDDASRVYMVAANAGYGGAAGSLPTVSVTASQAEAPEGETFAFTLRRSGNLDSQSVVAYRLVPGVASATIGAADSADLAGGLQMNDIAYVTFGIGAAVATVNVGTFDGPIFEFDEQFKLELVGASSSNVVVPATGAAATVTIRDNDTPPALSVSFTGDSWEGSSGPGATPGTNPFVFTITRDQVTPRVSTVSWTVQGAASVASGDLVGTPFGTVTFNAFQTAATVTVNVKADYAIEDDENFAVVLTNPVNAVLNVPSAAVTIYNDDQLPLFRVDATASGVAEGNSGQSPLVFTVSRSGNAGLASTVSWSVAGDTDGLTAADFSTTAATLPSGVLSFAIGETAKTVTVSVVGDTDATEGDEGFRVMLAPGVNAAIDPNGGGQAMATIYDDDHVSFAIQPALATLVEGSDVATRSAYTPFVFTLTRSGLSPEANVTSVVDWRVVTAGISASLAADPDDFVGYSGTALPLGSVTFAAGVGVQTITLNVADDTLVESAEGFFLRMVGNGVTYTATGSIAPDVADTPPPAEFSLAVINADLLEGNTGTTPFTFQVTRTGDLSQAWTLGWQVEGPDSNISYADFGTGGVGDLPLGRVTFVPNQSLATITVAVRGDTMPGEGDETFRVRLVPPVSNITTPLANSYTLAADIAEAIVRDDDGVLLPDYAGNDWSTARDFGGFAATTRSITGDTVGNLLADGSTDLDDYYRFRVDSAGSISLSLTGITVGADADVYVFGWDDANFDGEVGEGEITQLGQGVLASNANESVVLPYVNPGDYFVQVTAYTGATPYTLTLGSRPIADGAGNSLAAARAVTVAAMPSVVTDFVGGQDRNDYYRFTVGAASRFALGLTGMTDDADVRLLDGAGQVVAYSILAGAEDESIVVNSLAAGQYYVWVSPWSDAATFYNLSLRAETLEAANRAYNTAETARVVSLPGTVSTISDAVGLADGQDYYKFTLASPANFRLTLGSIATGADIDVELLNGDEVRIAGSATAGNAAEAFSADGLAAGTYYVRVFQVAGASAYALNMSATTVTRADNGGNVGAPKLWGTLGATVTTVSDYVGSDDPADFFKFTVSSGAKRMAIDLTGMSSDLDVLILDANGVEIAGGYTVPTNAGKEDGPADEVFDVLFGTDPDGAGGLPALQAGDYYLKVVQGGSAPSGSSTYRLDVSMQDVFDADGGSGADSRGIPENGGLDITSLLTTGTTPTRVVPTGATSTAYTDFVGSLDPHDYYHFTTDGPRNLRLTMNGMTANADVELLDANGSVVRFSRSNGTTQESISVDNLAAGDYFVHVSRVGNANTRYSLNMTAMAPTDVAGNLLTGTGTAGPKVLTLTGTTTVISDYVGSDDGADDPVKDTMDYYKFTLSSTGTVSFKLAGLTGAADMHLYKLTGTTTLNELAGVDWGTINQTGTTEESFVFSDVAAGTYVLAVTPQTGQAGVEAAYTLSAWGIGNNPTDGAGRLLATSVLPSYASIDDSFDYAANQLAGTTGGPKVVALTTAVQTFRDFVSYTDDTHYDDDWYKVTLGNVTPNSGGRIIAGLSGLVNDANLAIYSYGNGTFTRVAESANAGTLNEAILSDNLAAGTYYVRVYHVAEDTPITGYALTLSQVARDDYVSSIEAIQAGGSVGTISMAGTGTDLSGSLRGGIELADDVDWIKVHLTAGTYTFSARGKASATDTTNTLTDTVIAGIYNGSGTLLANSSGDDSVRTTTSGNTTQSVYSSDAQVTLYLAAEGDYYVAAKAYGALTGSYTLQVSSRNEAPVVTNPIGNQRAPEGSPFVLRLPWNVFQDPEGRPLTLTATKRNGDALPDWLTYDTAARMFVGTPPVGSGNVEVRLRATDPGFDGDPATTADNKYVDCTFTIETPTVTDDFAAAVTTTGTVTVGGDRRGNIETQYDVDWIRVSLTADHTYTVDLRGTSGNGRLSDPMITGIYDATGNLVANTTNDDFGDSLDSRVTIEARSTGNYFIAVSGAATSTGAYKVYVAESEGGGADNTAPVFHAGTPGFGDFVEAREGAAFIYTVPSDVFTDDQALSYTAKLSDGSALPSWLTFNAATRTFTATAVPANIADLDVRITATDTYGLSTSRDMVVRTVAANESQGTWTLMVYIAADNDLEQYALKDLNEMESVTLASGVRLVVLVDRHSGYSTADGNWTDTRRGLIRQDANLSSVTSLTSTNSVGELNTGSAATLTDFINWSASNYRADNYGLVVWDHGGGLSGTCWDFTSDRDNLTVAETTNAIANSLLGSVDFLGFDTCLQGMVEQAVDVQSVADFVVASEDLEPGDGWDYSRWLATFNANASPTALQVATGAVNAYGTAYQNTQTLSAIDTSRLSALTTKINDFITATEAMGNDGWDDLLAARNADGVTDYNDNDYLDLGAYMDTVAADADLSSTLQNAAAAVSQALDAAVVAQTQVSGASGLSVFLPGTEAAANAADYTSSNFRFLADTRWSSFVQNLASHA